MNSKRCDQELALYGSRGRSTVVKFGLLLIKRRCEQIFKVTFLESTFLNPGGVGDDERAALDRLGEGDEEGLRAAWEDAQDRAEAAAEEGPDGQRAPAVSSDGKQFSFLFELREKECAYLELSVCLSVWLAVWLAGWLASWLQPGLSCCLAVWFFVCNVPAIFQAPNQRAFVCRCGAGTSASITAGWRRP